MFKPTEHRKNKPYKYNTCSQVFTLNHSFLSIWSLILRRRLTNKNDVAKTLPRMQILLNIRIHTKEKQYNCEEGEKTLFSIHSLFNTWKFILERNLKGKECGTPYDWTYNLTQYQGLHIGEEFCIHNKRWKTCPHYTLHKSQNNLGLKVTLKM